MWRKHCCSCCGSESQCSCWRSTGATGPCSFLPEKVNYDIKESSNYRKRCQNTCECLASDDKVPVWIWVGSKYDCKLLCGVKQYFISFHFLSLVLLHCCWIAQAQSVFGWRQVDTLSKQPVYRIETNSLLHSRLRPVESFHLASGLSQDCGRSRRAWRKPTQEKPQALQLCGENANHCTTVLAIRQFDILLINTINDPITSDILRKSWRGCSSPYWETCASPLLKLLICLSFVMNSCTAF